MLLAQQPAILVIVRVATASRVFIKSRVVNLIRACNLVQLVVPVIENGEELCNQVF